MTLGIDVSHYQPSTPTLAGLDFLFAKATEGVTFIDPLYPTHTAAARKAGLIVGAYHFGVAGDGAAQAKAFLAVAATADLLALDLEGSRLPMTEAQARAFIAAVHAAGRKVGLYHSRSGFPSLGQDWNWVADWTGTVPSGTVPSGIPWTFWQYRGSPLDLDRFNGSRAQLNTLAGKARPARVRILGPFGLYRLGPPVTRTLRVTRGMSADVGPITARVYGGKTRHLVRLLTGALAGGWVNIDAPNVRYTKGSF